jgi:hypothetical protein
MAYRLIGGDTLQLFHLKSLIYGDKLGLMPADGLTADPFRRISDPELHLAAVEDALLKIAAAGPTGKKLADFAQSTDFDILCWPGLPGEFLCPYEVNHLPAIDGATWGRTDRATVLWDPYYEFAYYSRHNENYKLSDDETRTLGELAQGFEKMFKTVHSVTIRENAAAEQAGWDARSTQALEDRIVKDQRIQVMRPRIMPAWIVLAHELGHYWHWRNYTAWFEDALRNKQLGIIEARNLHDHENPILRYQGLDQRYLYQDFVGGSNDTKVGTAMHALNSGANTARVPDDAARLKVVLEADLQRLTVLKSQKPKEIRFGGAAYTPPPASAKRVCPRCNKSFGAAMYDPHVLTCKGKV